MKTRFALALASAALLSLPAMAQTAPAPGARTTAPESSSVNTQTQLKPGEWRASKLIGLSVYNSQNDNIGSIKELIVDQQGSLDSAVIGAGGVVGMGERDVAVPFKDLKWSNQTTSASNSGSSTTNTSGTSGTPNRTASNDDNGRRGYPDHAVLDMTKDQLKQLPEINYTR
ncbi:MAG TPA: PRC-barrel domain-containing protein [Stellaceae bacterium]|nr:PRC-barrel domain-containing protein [Stellaceae bacterium]